MVFAAESVRAYFLAANQAPHRRTLNGREYLVAHLSLIVPGVLPGSQGALFYPAAECARNVGGWNGMPLTMYHPLDAGSHVSAWGENGKLSDRVWEQQGIGFVRNPAFNGKLRAHGWFDVGRVKNADRRFGTNLLQRLERGEPVELSTGLFTDNEPKCGGWKGRPYTHVARNYRPDHVAVLPDQVGACSLQDGCGVGVVNAADKKKGCGDGG